MATGTQLRERVRALYDAYGQRKAMGSSASNSQLPHYFLLRTFFGENDLLIILNTKRCRYQCYFCQLPAKSSRVVIPTDDIVAQFEYVLDQEKHALSIVDRVTLSNEGSILDRDTVPMEALLAIAECVHELRRVRMLTLETRLEFVEPDVIRELQVRVPRAKINILTGFETFDAHIRDRVLGKRETIDDFLRGLDCVAQSGCQLTAYVLYKPAPQLSDTEAFAEAKRSIDFLADQCNSRNIPLSIRLNPMYLAKGSRWARAAMRAGTYTPPSLIDIMRLAEYEAMAGRRIYIGLSTEGLDEAHGTYMARTDYASALIRPIKLFNDGKLTHFDWAAIAQAKEQV